MVKNSIITVILVSMLTMVSVPVFAYDTTLPTKQTSDDAVKNRKHSHHGKHHATKHKDDIDLDANDYDPLEGFNRGIYGFNRVLDGVLLSPLAHIYRGLMPEAGQRSVHNIFSNLNSPVVLLNSLLQGDVNNAGHTVARFVINSTAGVAGIFDVASDVGIKKVRDKDFGQTLGVYGVGKGPYIVLPILGPSDGRDFVGLVADVLTDPLTYILTTPEGVAYESFKGIVKRADLINLTDKINRDSLDPYTSYRSIYLQNRDKKVRDYMIDENLSEKHHGKVK